MRIALDCAPRGVGSVEPNPPVGAVIVRDGVEIARGWHGRFGGPHAEREALAAARAAGADVRGATMYVTLEPCCHHGKTPPCTDALLDAGIARVVVAMADPDEHVAGGGIAQLREAGVAVDVGVCAAEAGELLAPYVTLRTQGRPWVICKWAQTADGYLALPAGRGRWVSGEESRRAVHELRGLCDAILVGVGTVLADDPLLTNRGDGPKRPVRVVLDSRLRTPPNSRLVRTAGKTPMLIATSHFAATNEVGRADALRAAGAELIELSHAGDELEIGLLLDELGRRGWTYLLVEGGARVLRSFVSGGLADELMVFTSPQSVGDVPQPAGTAPGSAAAAPQSAGAAGEDLPRFDLADVLDPALADHPDRPAWRLVEERPSGADTLRRYRVE